MHSCIYEGTVTHCRHEPVTHQFQYRLFMVYLDLDELPSLVGRGGLIASRKYSSRSLLRSDHLFDKVLSLATELRQIVRKQTGTLPTGPIRMLTQLRYCGYYFSPINVFYVYDEDDTRVQYVVAEVNNTPWKERHCYVLWDGNRIGPADSLQFAHAKEFHVSPFMGMEMEYRWSLSEPGEHSTIGLANFEDSRKVFDAGMTLRRRELTKQQLRRMTVRYAFMTAQIGAAIYFQALRLWWKKCPFYPHPKPHSSSLSPATNKKQHSPPSEANIVR